MRIAPLGLLMAILMNMGAMAPVAAGSPWPHQIIDSMDGRRLVLFLQDEDVANSPQWQPEKEGALPMSITEAMTHLKSWMKDDSRYRGARIQEIEVKRIHEHEKEDRWYFLVQLRVPSSHPVLSYVAVLFTGKVVPAIVEPESIK